LYASINANKEFLGFNKGSFPRAAIKAYWEYTDDKLRTIVLLYKNGRPTFRVHQKLDLGTFVLWTPTNIKSIRLKYKGPDTTSVGLMKRINLKSIKKMRNVSEVGDEIYFVGFPFGLGTSIKINPVVRSGTIAMVDKDDPNFLLDAFSYGGNSGSPIFTKSDANGRSKFIGIVSGYLGVKNENFGLAKCIWVDDILKFLDQVKLLYFANSRFDEEYLKAILGK